MLHDLTKFKLIKNITIGYFVVYYPEHPSAGKGSGIVYLHRLVMENYLDRYLENDEIVHHKDGDRENNDIDNLLLTTKAAHCLEHHPAFLKPIPCPKCGKEFKPLKSNQKYCSPKCGKKPKIKCPTIEWLEDRLKDTPYTTLAKELGVSDNAIRRHIRYNKKQENPNE